jgi:hypothetical protein
VDLTSHGTDEELEHYALGRLPNSALSVLETHLIACDGCRQRLDHIAHFALAMREVLSTQPEPATAARKWFPFLRRPAFPMALGSLAFAALVVIAFAISGGRTSFVPVATLQLSAMRGEMQSAAPTREMDITLLDVPQAGGPFPVELVDDTGKALWFGIAVASSRGAAEIKMRQTFESGDYFLRLYSADRRVIHEYGFRVKS